MQTLLIGVKIASPIPTVEEKEEEEEEAETEKVFGYIVKFIRSQLYELNYRV